MKIYAGGEGWFIRIVRDKRVVGVAGSGPSFLALAKDQQALEQYVAQNWPQQK